MADHTEKEAFAQRLVKRSLPILRDPHEIAKLNPDSFELSPGSRWKLQGTGSLFAVDGLHFLVSAAHVLVDQEVAGTLAIPCPNRVRMFTLEGRGCEGIHKKPNAPDVDVGIVRLPGEFAAELQDAGHAFLGPEDLWGKADHGTREGEAAYICGFPDAWADSNDARIAIPFLYAGSRASPEQARFTELRYDPGFHQLIRLREEGIDHKGREQVTPPLHGVSGGPVWWTVKPNSPAGLIWTPPPVKLRAVQIEVYPKARFIRATSWHVVAEMIVNQFPETRPTLAPLYGWEL